MNEKKKYKVGDKIRCDDNGAEGVVMSIEKDGHPKVRFFDGAVGKCMAAVILATLASCGNVEVAVRGNFVEAKRSSWVGDTSIVLACPKPPELVVPVVRLPLFVTWQKKGTLAEKPEP